MAFPTNVSYCQLAYYLQVFADSFDGCSDVKLLGDVVVFWGLGLKFNSR